MRKIVWYGLVLYGALINAQGDQQDAQIQAIKAQIKQQRDALIEVVLSIAGGADFLKELKDIKLQFSLISQELGVSQLFAQLRTLLQQECTLVMTDEVLQPYLQRFSELQRDIQDFLQSPEGQSIQQLQKTLSIIYETPVLTYEQEQQAEKVRSQIQTLMQQKLGPVLEEKRVVDTQIGIRLSNYTKQVNTFSTQIQTIVKSDPKMTALRQKIKDFRTNAAYRWLIIALKQRLDPLLADLEDLYGQLDTLEQTCVLVAPGVFTSPSSLFELINQTTVELLLRD